jgi:hypothetical protein
VVFDFEWKGIGPFIIDDFAPPRFLTVDGLATATGSGDDLAGTFVGLFRGFEEPGDIWGWGDLPVSWCHSTRHHFELSR